MLFIDKSIKEVWKLLIFIISNCSKGDFIK